ncbi:hypothetical protein [Nonomuraea typhae]|uniref:SH3 domain-containing protein n=1 Tax=Nonomuraea typhae TaxID=2603600 RepID=A0ABW7Z6Z8_9ACTN
MRSFTRILALLVVAAPIGLLAPGAAAAAEGCVYVAAPPYPANLWVRSGPGTQYEPVGSVGYEETVEGSCGSRGSWTRVWGEDFEGWAYAPYLGEADEDPDY